MYFSYLVGINFLILPKHTTMGVGFPIVASCLVAEIALGNALKASGRDRDEYVLATKANGDCLIPDNLRATFKRSLENLQTDHIDILQIHWPNDAVPPSVYMPVIQEFIEEGSLRAVGISNHGCQDMQTVLDTGVPIISNQLPYNLLNRIVEDSVRSLSISLISRSFRSARRMAWACWPILR